METGADHSVAVTVDGSCYGWGNCQDGALGQNTFFMPRP
ncbi:MAG: hypothetical protein ACK56I_34725 [bacterium]